MERWFPIEEIPAKRATIHELMKNIGTAYVWHLKKHQAKKPVRNETQQEESVPEAAKSSASDEALAQGYVTEEQLVDTDDKIEINDFEA